jgi:hypothetical protein
MPNQAAASQRSQVLRIRSRNDLAGLGGAPELGVQAASVHAAAAAACCPMAGEPGCQLSGTDFPAGGRVAAQAPAGLSDAGTPGAGAWPQPQHRASSMSCLGEASPTHREASTHEQTHLQPVSFTHQGRMPAEAANTSSSLCIKVSGSGQGGERTPECTSAGHATHITRATASRIARGLFSLLCGDIAFQLRAQGGKGWRLSRELCHE